MARRRAQGTAHRARTVARRTVAFGRGAAHVPGVTMDGLREKAVLLARRTVKGAAALALHHSGARNLLSAIERRAVGGRRVLLLSYHRVVGNYAEEARRG